MSPKLLNIFLGLVIGLLYLGVYKPLDTGLAGIGWTPDSSISALKATNVQYANTLKLVTDVETGVKKINQNYTSISEATTTLVETMLPDYVDPIQLHNEIVNIADTAGVSVTAINITLFGRNNIAGVGSYVVSFIVKGRYPLIKNLLQEFEKNKRFYNIDALNIEKQETKRETRKREAKMKKEDEAQKAKDINNNK